MNFEIDIDAPAFRDLDRSLLREVDAFISNRGVEIDEDEVTDIGNIMADFEANPFG